MWSAVGERVFWVVGPVGQVSWVVQVAGQVGVSLGVVGVEEEVFLWWWQGVGVS